MSPDYLYNALLQPALDENIELYGMPVGIDYTRSKMAEMAGVAGFPINGTEEEKLQFTAKTLASGIEGQIAEHQADEATEFDAGPLIMAGLMAGVGGLSGGFGMSDLMGGMGGADTGAGYDFGMTGMEGAETLMPPAQLPSTAGYEAMPFESASGAPATQYNLVNPEAAAAGMGLPPMPSGGLPSMPPGASTLANQLAKALAGSGGTGAGSGAGGALFGQGGTPGGQSYMRKARAPMTQPAFLGEQGQQPLGAMEDAMFNEASGERRDDVSNRARQMAAQIRGRPGFFGFRSG